MLKHCFRVHQEELARGTPPYLISLIGIGQGGLVAVNAALRGYRWHDPDDEDELDEAPARVGCLVGMCTCMCMCVCVLCVGPVAVNAPLRGYRWHDADDEDELDEAPARVGCLVGMYTCMCMCVCVCVLCRSGGCECVFQRL